MSVVGAFPDGDWFEVRRLLTDMNSGLVTALALATSDSDGFGLTLAGVRVRFGTGTWTWPGGTAKSSNTVTTHGLGKTPTVVLVCGASLNGGNETSAGEAGSYTSTQFTSRATLTQGLAPGAGATNSFVWVAIG